MIEVVCDCGNRSNMDNPDGWVCECEVKALREVAEKAKQYLDSEESGHQDAMLRQRRQLKSALAALN